MTMKKTKINAIWEELESDSSFHTGLLYKRYSVKVIPDVYIALKNPEKIRCIAANISSSFIIDYEKLNQFKDIKIETINNVKNPDKQFFLILLLNSQLNDIFSTLCQDLICKVSQIKDEIILVDKLYERLFEWQLLFEKLGKQGLSENSQRGLYGELYFLRTYLSKNLDYEMCVNSWMGPERAIQDFQYSDWAVEVKTTHGKNHQKIQINSERQLDDSIIPKIFLYHLSLDIRKEYGETLNSIIKEILEILSTDSFATHIFKLKLINAGYFERHSNLYNDTGYQIRYENVYSVTGNFPRITEKQIPDGVGDIKYSIILSESEDWKIDVSNLFSSISGD
ncbi:PD-(D/E)XK motif protein [uncultured Methanolobus sp.]|uniref:PD-(D/E)XK motif protein n=1 Tax=uncultured Methanolobus sp. TaxID=218300 RepID=UPI0029C7EC23|nr:PD-(D/E)XK motif protein [uncultured Methanolobus sp.]